MLTLRKLRVATEEPAAARRIADYVLMPGESPGAFAANGSASGGRLPPSAIWSGTPRMLEALAVESGAETHSEELAVALQGCSPADGHRLRREGMIELPLLDDRGRPVHDARGWTRKRRVKGTKSVDLTFSAPKSVSVVWSQAEVDLRVEIEAAMLHAAGAMVECLTTTKPVISWRREMQPGVGFAAALALHVTARAALGDVVPAPQLHVHAVLLGVERRDGLFASPELAGLFKHGAPLEGGALARAALAERLVDLGFSIDSETGERARFFEIHGVPHGLIARMSPRTADVVAKVSERETGRAKPLSGRERAVAAMQTRAPKRGRLSAAEIAAAWSASAAEFDFGREAVRELRKGSGSGSGSGSGAGGFGGPVDARMAHVSAQALRKIQSGGAASIGATRAAVLESAAGRLRLGEALRLAAELEAAGAI
jgi:conjugative relaxase-like TrwC/TraI family protein